MNNQVDSAEAQAHRLEHVYAQLARELSSAEVRQRLTIAAGDDEWSTMQILGHLVEMIPYWLGHCRRLITASGSPPSFGRSLDAPDRLAGVAQGQSAHPDELLGLLKQEIDTAAASIRRMTPEERTKTGIHLRRGEMTVAEILETLVVSHAEEHVAQVRRTLNP